MSRRLVEATSRYLARRSPRRGFLAKSAVVGSALAVAPKDFITKPASAYARVCNCSGSSCDCSQLCCDGYTEFCCTMYGTNGCPPGSLYGGWWRVSGSNFCGGNNRYYLDCHNPCNGCSCGASGICSGSCNGTPCGCGLGSCRNRKAGCTHFRYGQCNRQIDCLGPIVCRVVTCTPPWQLEPNCSTSIRTDEATRNHHRPCLEESGNAPIGRLDRVRAQPGLIRVRGWAIDPDVVDPITVNVFLNGELVTSALADRTRPDVGAAYGRYGQKHGFDTTFPSTLGTKQICVSAVNVGGGPNVLLGCRTVRVTAGPATGVLESVSASAAGLDVKGWALVQGSKQKLDVDLYVNDAHAGTVRANRARRDLATTFGVAGNRHGFSANLQAAAGPTTVCARVTDPETGEVVEIGCMKVRLASNPPHGVIDLMETGADSIHVVGWVLDPDGGDVEVGIVVDGVEVTRVPADLPRPDVAITYGAAEQTGGFDIEVSADGGDHNVCVYTYGSDGETGPLLGCADVSVG